MRASCPQPRERSPPSRPCKDPSCLGQAVILSSSSPVESTSLIASPSICPMARGRQRTAPRIHPRHEQLYTVSVRLLALSGFQVLFSSELSGNLSSTHHVSATQQNTETGEQSGSLDSQTQSHGENMTSLHVTCNSHPVTSRKHLGGINNHP